MSGMHEQFGPSDPNPVDVIRGEIRLNVTMLVKVLASQWDNIKGRSPGESADVLYNMLEIAGAHDLMADVNDYESAARQNGWTTADMTPGMLVRGVVGQPQADIAQSWEEACKLDNLVVPTFPIRQVYVVTDNLYAQLALLHERVTVLCGHKVWANHRDGTATVEFFRKLYDDRSDALWSTAIAANVERHRSSLGETEAEEAARDKWEANST